MKKLYKISLALMLGIGTLTSCNDKLELTNPNQPTTGTFGNNVADLEEAVIACYHHIRMEGTYARVGYTLDAVRGDEMWNAAQGWGYYLADKMAPSTTDEIYGLWSWRDWYYAINIANFVITKCGEDDAALSQAMRRIKGQALFVRALAYYNLTGYYQNPALILDYNQYSSLSGLYASNWQQGDESKFDQFDRVMDQVEKDFAEAMTLLPSRSEGGEWAKGRATNGAAAGYYARALMQRHKYSEALVVLKEIIKGTYGTYSLMANFGDNFREGSAYENNAESLFEVQFMDYGSQGTDDEWTPVNISKNASQGHAVESNFGPGDFGGWADLSAAPWLYDLYKQERTTNGSLDPRLYWTICTYEPEWSNFEYGNVCYGSPIPADKAIITNNNNGGLPIAKWTNMRTGLYNSVVVGLKCGINLRLMRYSDVLLRAAECENEVSGPTQQAIDWINEVRNRAHLTALQLSDFDSKDKLFEQIANVERPKEFGCEFGRGLDLLRWGFYYSADRMQQLKEHGVYKLYVSEQEAAKQATKAAGGSDEDAAKAAAQVLRDNVKVLPVYGESGVESSYDTYQTGHEFFPIWQTTLNNNPNLVGNSANETLDNASYFTKKGWTIHPVVDLTNNK